MAADLIQINASYPRHGRWSISLPEIKMPTETVLAIVALLVVFGSFMGALAWATWSTRHVTARW